MHIVNCIHTHVNSIGVNCNVQTSFEQCIQKFDNVCYRMYHDVIIKLHYYHVLKLNHS